MNNIKVEFGEGGVDGLSEIDINANNEVARGIAKARIEGLWWKAQMGYNDQRCDPEVVAKFAELIVKECAMFSMVVTDDHYDVDAVYKHFGVDDE